jgi:hypothetical protein
MIITIMKGIKVQTNSSLVWCVYFFCGPNIKLLLNLTIPQISSVITIIQIGIIQITKMRCHK